MPSQLATLLCFLFIFYLFWTELKKKIDGVSRAIWIPLFWMILAGSRYVSQWLNLGAPVEMTTDVYLEGSPMDRAGFLILIIVGALILYKRHLNWRMLFRKNIFIWLYFIFGAVSIIWSDYSFISLKRLVKALGNVIMALIILTEQRPDEAIGAILRRLAFLLLPLSVLFIMYYPNLGREYHVTGAQMFTGATLKKNSLGALCLISGIYFGWNLLVNTQRGIGSGNKLHFLIYLTIIPMIVWLLYMANSATSTAIMAIAICLFLLSRIRVMARKPRMIFNFSLAAISVFLVLEATIGLTTLIVVNILGRDTTLTTRVPMWYGLLKMAGNPIVGVGYDSFWLGARLEALWQAYGKLIQAHNGYLEVYLNLGLIGLSLILINIISGLIKVQKQLHVEYPFAILRLTLIVVVAIYNWTEATFYGVNNMWLLQFLGILDMSGQQKEGGIHMKEADMQSVDPK